MYSKRHQEHKIGWQGCVWNCMPCLRFLKAVQLQEISQRWISQPYDFLDLSCKYWDFNNSKSAMGCSYAVAMRTVTGRGVKSGRQSTSICFSKKKSDRRSFSVLNTVTGSRPEKKLSHKFEFSINQAPWIVLVRPLDIQWFVFTQFYTVGHSSNLSEKLSESGLR